VGGKEKKSPRSAAAPPLISRKGWRCIAAGIAIAAVGYLLLSHTDPAGRNWASRISPVLILTGYGVVGYGILARDSVRSSVSASAHP